MHSNHITIEGEKISKSLGNGITLEDIEAKGISLEAFRLHVLESHYRSQSKFSWASLEAAQNRLKNWQSVAALLHQPNDIDLENPQPEFLETARDIRHLLQDDLSTPQVLAVLSQLFATLETNGLNFGSTAPFQVFLETVDELLGLHLATQPDVTDAQKQLIEARETARVNKDWAKSDELRDQLSGQGIGLRDTPNGAIWYRL
jgi:cysteinyl-tRNA synthetase